MGKNSKATSGAVGQSNLLYFMPEQLTVVTDPTHALYQKRATQQPSAAFVASIRKTHGNREPVVLRPNGKDEKGVPINELVAGRKRVMAVAIGNQQIQDEGGGPDDLMKVAAIMMPRGSDIEDCLDFMAIENAHREDLSTLEKAEEICRFLKRGRESKDVAELFNISTATVKNYEQVNGLHPDCKKAIRDGAPITIVKELHELPMEKQPEALEKLLASGPLKGARGREAAKQLGKHKDAKPTTVRMLARPHIERWHKTLKVMQAKGDTNRDIALVNALLKRILGKEDALSAYPKIEKALSEQPA